MVPLIVRFLQFLRFLDADICISLPHTLNELRAHCVPHLVSSVGPLHISHFALHYMIHLLSLYIYHVCIMYMLSITCMHVLNPSLCPQLCLFSIVWRPEPICVMSASKQTYQRPWASIDGEDHRDDQY